MTAKTVFEARSYLESNWLVIQQIARRVAHRTSLDVQERDDFVSYVIVKLLEDDVRRIRLFRGDAPFEAYLTTVIKRLSLDFHIERRGKWRPSKRAESLGPRAERLEVLVFRDGLSLAEAEGILATEFRGEATPTVAELLAELPVRLPRREVAIDAMDATDDVRVGESELAESPESESLLARVALELERALDDMCDADRELLRLKFEEQLPLSRLATSPKSQRRLYQQIRRLVQRLRNELESSGVEGQGVLRALHVVGSAIDVPFRRHDLEPVARTA